LTAGEIGNRRTVVTLQQRKVSSRLKQGREISSNLGKLFNEAAGEVHNPNLLEWTLDVYAVSHRKESVGGVDTKHTREETVKSILRDPMLLQPKNTLSVMIVSIDSVGLSVEV
jgi:hypothetical protein